MRRCGGRWIFVARGGGLRGDVGTEGGFVKIRCG